MSLANALRNIPEAQHRHRKCGVGVLLDTLNTDDSTALAEALANPDLTGSSIAHVLKNGGHRISANTLNRHRRGDCTCGTETQ